MFFSTEMSSANVINNEYGQSSMQQQRNPLEQAVFDDEKRSINALSLFISKCLKIIAIIWFLFSYACSFLIFRAHLRSDCSLEDFM